MSAVLLPALVAGLLTLAGAGWLRLLRFQPECGPEALGLSFATGAAWLACTLVLLAPFPGAARLEVLALLLLLPAGFLLRRRPVGTAGPWGRGWAGFLPVAVVFLLALWFATQRPVWNVDAQKRWVLHGQWTAAEGTVLPQRVRDPSWAASHPAYPPLVPAVVGLALELGADRDTGLRPLFPFFFLALLGVLHGFARRRAGPRLACLVTAAFALTPCFLYLHRSGGAIGLGADAALADVPSALFAAALGTLLLTAGSGSRGAARAAAAAAAGCALVKQETAVLALAMLAAAGLAALRPRHDRRERLQALAPAAGAFAAAFLLWRLAASGFPVEAGEDYLSPAGLARLFQNLPRAGPVLARMFEEHLRLGTWGGLWLLPLLLAALRLPRLLRGREGEAGLLLLWLVLAEGLAAAAYVSTGWKGGAYAGLMEVSLTRVLMHHAPLAALAAVSLLQVSSDRPSGR